MKYYKLINDGIIAQIGCGSAIHETQTEITKEEYDSLMAVFNDRPVDTFESVYYFDAETEFYLPRERTHDEVIEWYIRLVELGTITLDEVPEEYRDVVRAEIPEPRYTLDEASEIITQEVASDEV